MGYSSSVGEWCGRLIDESRSASCLCHACLRHPLDARRGPCCCPGRFTGRVPSPLVHPLCLLNQAGDTPLPERHRSSRHCMGPSSSRNTVFPVEHSWSLGRQALLCSPGHVPVPPRVSAPCFRRNHRPECARHGVWASLVFALPFPPRRPARLPALLPPVLSPLGLGAKTGSKVGAKIGAQRRPPFRRGSRARPASGSGRAAGAPPPCRGVASLPSARLDNAFWQIHRRGLGAPGPDQGCPLWLHAPRWTRRTWAIHPAALSRLWRGVASRDQPPEAPSFVDSVFRRWTQLEFLGVGHGSLLFAATAQQTNQGGVAGARPPFDSAWGQIRWSFGRTFHRLGTVVPCSFTSDRGIHVNRIGGRSAGADLPA